MSLYYYLKQYCIIGGIAIGITFLLPACHRGEKTPDISHISMDISIHRFEKDLFELDPSKIAEEVPALEATYGDFFNLFNQKIIQIGSTNNPAYPEYLKTFISDFINYKVYEKVVTKYPDLKGIEEELNQAFAYYAYYFTEKPIPQIFSCISGFNYSVVTSDSLIALCLDNYLGPDEPYYTQLGIYNYRKRNMHEKKIPSDLFQIWGKTEFPFNDSITNLANQMIYEGRNMYFAKHMLPEQPDSLVWGFTPHQLQFCASNEQQMWTYLIEHKVLFSNEKLLIHKFIEEAPFTKDFTRESPGKAAVWLGYQITKAFMKKNSDVTLEKLMHIRDYQYILNNSGYNP